MSQQSNIEWTDATWNPVRGCVKVSPGCANCYAETFAERWRGVHGHPYEQGFDLRLVPEKLTEPLKWKTGKRIFVNSMSDLFQDGVPDEFIDQVFAVMALCPQHTFQVLTKRADRMRAYLLAGIHTSDSLVFERVRLLIDGRAPMAAWPLPNVWLGVSVENQHFADERIPLLLQTPAAVRFISAEPLLGPVTFRWAKWDDHAPNARRAHPHWPPVERDGRIIAGSVSDLDGLRMLDWVIVGGESGPGARTFEVAWARSVIKQCQAARVPVFVKQLGAAIRIAESPLDEWPSASLVSGPSGGMGRFIGLRDRKGGDMAEWPADLRVREFPNAKLSRGGLEYGE